MTQVNIYVGNLNIGITGDDIREAFEKFGEVSSVSIVTDKESGELKEFGYVVMPNQNEADNAISSMNGKELKGCKLDVKEAPVY